MEGEVDTFDFVLAEALYMIVEEMQDRMSNYEYLSWRAFYTWRAAQRELEAKTVEARRAR